jgi:hypothetical protein
MPEIRRYDQRSFGDVRCTHTLSYAIMRLTCAGRAEGAMLDKHATDSENKGRQLG